MGDDMTDEDAFKVLRPYGPTIRLGRRKNSHAELFIKSIEDVIRSGVLIKEAKRLYEKKIG